MIKVFVRAIVSTDDHYLLMGEKDYDGKITWDLPGGALAPGVDIKQYLQQIVLQSTGYTISGLEFFEIVCRVRPRSRDESAYTAIDFVFTSRVASAASQPPTAPIELLPHANFEWLSSGGRFKQDKVMALIGKYHHQKAALSDDQLKTNADPAI